LNDQIEYHLCDLLLVCIMIIRWQLPKHSCLGDWGSYIL
jgi:hypothetical protein